MSKPILVFYCKNITQERFAKLNENFTKHEISRDYYGLFLTTEKEDKIELLSIKDVSKEEYQKIVEESQKLLYHGKTKGN